jgi:hypothetical protein
MSLDHVAPARPHAGSGIPVVSLDYDATDTPEPCVHCDAWHFEVVTDHDGVPVLREWHRSTCPTFVEWSNDD